PEGGGERGARRHARFEEGRAAAVAVEVELVPRARVRAGAERLGRRVVRRARWASPARGEESEGKGGKNGETCVHDWLLGLPRATGGRRAPVQESRREHFPARTRARCVALHDP